MLTFIITGIMYDTQIYNKNRTRSSMGLSSPTGNNIWVYIWSILLAESRYSTIDYYDTILYTVAIVTHTCDLWKGNYFASVISVYFISRMFHDADL